MREESNGERTRVIANGARDIWMQVNIGGITAVNNRATFVNFYPSVDAIQEFKVQSANYSAEYGGKRARISTCNSDPERTSSTGPCSSSCAMTSSTPAATSGRAASQGRVAPESVRRRARRPGDPRQDVLHGQLRGKPVRYRTRRYLVVLTPEMRRGDFSGVSGAVTDPLNGAPPRKPDPAEPAESRFGGPDQSIYAAAQRCGAVNFAGVTPNIVNIDQGIGRVDHSFGAHDQVFVHYIYSARKLPNTELNPNFFYNATFPTRVWPLSTFIRLVRLW